MRIPSTNMVAGIVAATGLAVTFSGNIRAHGNPPLHQEQMAGYKVSRSTALSRMDRICSTLSGCNVVVGFKAEPWFSNLRPGETHPTWLVRGTAESGENILTAQIDATTGYLLTVTTHPDFDLTTEDHISPSAATVTARAWIASMRSYLPAQNWRLVGTPRHNGPRWCMNWRGDKLDAVIHVDSCHGGVSFATFHAA